MFERQLDPGLIQQLQSEPLFEKLRDDIRNGEVFPAIRGNRIDFYHKGGLLFRFDGKFRTHFKYASVLDFEKADPDYINEKDLRGRNPICSFVDGYPRIKQNCQLYSSVESEGVSALYSRHSYASTVQMTSRNVVILDIEVSFERQVDRGRLDGPAKEGKRTQDRIDLVLLNKVTRKLRFYEVKHFSNSEIWAQKGASPRVCKQLTRYDKQLQSKSEGILRAYGEYNRITNTLFDLQHEGPNGICEQTALLIFGYDSYQKDKINEMLLEDGSLKGRDFMRIGDLKTYARSNADLSSLWKQTRSVTR